MKAINLLQLKKVEEQKWLWTGLLGNQIINVLIKIENDKIQLRNNSQRVQIWHHHSHYHDFHQSDTLHNNKNVTP